MNVLSKIKLFKQTGKEIVVAYIDIKLEEIVMFSRKAKRMFDVYVDFEKEYFVDWFIITITNNYNNIDSFTLLIISA